MVDASIRSDVAAEKAVLGAVLLDGGSDVLNRVSSLLSESDFYVPAHALIWDAMHTLASRAEPIDPTTLVHELQRRNRINTVGGAQYFGELIELTPTTAHCEAHARIIAEHAMARRVHELGREIAARALDPSVSIQDLTALLHRRAMEATHDRRRGEMRPQHEVISALLDRVSKAMEGDVVGSLRTGFQRFDTLTGGLRPGQLVLIAARPAMGKTAFCENVGHMVAAMGRTVLWFSEEMPAEEVVNRRVSGASGVDARRSIGTGLSLDEADRYFNAARPLSGQPILWEDSGRVNAEDIAACARRARHAHPDVSLVIVDYIQRLRPIDTRAPRHEQVGATARELKSLAKEMGVPVIALAQLNRDLEKRPDKRPMLADLRDSGELEQEADIVGLLHRPWVYDRSANPKDGELIVAKHRGGPSFETIPLCFDGPRAQFTEAVVTQDLPPEPPWDPDPRDGYIG